MTAELGWAVALGAHHRRRHMVIARIESVSLSLQWVELVDEEGRRLTLRTTDGSSLDDRLGQWIHAQVKRDRLVAWLGPGAP